jgi:hypothetical protein
MTIDIKAELNNPGENFSKMIVNLAEDVIYKLKEEPNFTGKIIYTINCKNGGIGNTETFIQRRLK